MSARTSAERQSARRERGKAIGVVLTDPAAIKSLARLVKRLGGVKAAVEWALIRAAQKRAPNPIDPHVGEE